MLSSYLTLGPIRLQLHWPILFIAILLIFLFIKLSLWQANKAIYKENLLKNYQQATSHPPIPFKQAHILNLKANPLAYIYTQVSGNFVKDKHFLIQGSGPEQQPGYQVFSIFQPQDSEKMLIVKRGWIPKYPIPSLRALNDTALSKTVIGTLQHHDNQFMLSKQPLPANTKWPIVLPAFYWPHIEQFLQNPLHIAVLHLNDNQLASFEQLAVTFKPSPSRHRSYALQWLSLAILTMAYYLLTHVRKVATYD